MASFGSEAHRERSVEPASFLRTPEEAIERANRRAFPRHAVDCPVTVIPVGGVGQMAGCLSDLSLGGCLVRLEQRYLAGMLVRVEVQFQLRGIAFRILGVTAGTRGAQSFAVRFLEMPQRRREALAGVLDEVAAVNAACAGDTANAVNAANAEMAEGVASPEQVFGSGESAKQACAAEVAAAPQAIVDSTVSCGIGKLESEPPAAQAVSAAMELLDAAAAKARERRIYSRHAVDTSVKLLLIKSAIAMSGRIANLSLGGCSIRTDERFNVGIFVRVEAEFYLHGLPFRIAGVSQAIQDRNTIGIRFLDMSQRCRAQLVELIAEIEEAHALEADVAPGQALE